MKTARGVKERSIHCTRTDAPLSRLLQNFTFKSHGLDGTHSLEFVHDPHQGIQLQLLA